MGLSRGKEGSQVESIAQLWAHSRCSVSTTTMFISWGHRNFLSDTQVVTGVGEAKVLTGEGRSSWLPQTPSWPGSRGHLRWVLRNE